MPVFALGKLDVIRASSMPNASLSRPIVIGIKYSLAVCHKTTVYHLNQAFAV
jgi:hypothetical protein